MFPDVQYNNGHCHGPEAGAMGTAMGQRQRRWLILFFGSFNFTCVYSIFSHNVEFVEQSGRARLRTPSSVTSNGGAVRDRPHLQISDIAPVLESEGKSKKGRVAPDPEKKWKVILWYDTSHTTRLDPEDRK